MIMLAIYLKLNIKQNIRGKTKWQESFLKEGLPEGHSKNLGARVHQE